MPKSYNTIWKDVIDFETLYRAYKEARRGKKRYRHEPPVFAQNLEENLIIL
jgi:UDP-N-acetyl-D-mannosaminuronic acid transferase (WecB/TagA/CpsF family)